MRTDQQSNHPRLWRDKRGATLVLVAMTISALIGFASLGAETGLWYAIKRQNQSAADAGAISAAYEIIYDLANAITPTSANLTPAASQAATQNSYTGATAVVTYPYSDAIVTSGVAVTLQTTQAASLASLFLPSVAIATQAVARVVVLDNPCILALNKTASKAIDLAGNPTVSAPGCSVVADSTSSNAIHFQGSASMTADTIVTPGNISYTGSAFTVNSTPLVGSAASYVPDPYASTLTHSALVASMPTSPTCTKPASTWSGSCKIMGSAIKTGDTLSANTQISGGLSFKNGTINLLPGTYWITDGDLVLQNGSGATLICPTCTPGGAGVTIILTTAQPSGGTVGALTLDSNANLTLNAPKTGAFAGMVLIQDSNGLPPGTTINTPSNAQAGATETLTGLVYFPKSAITFQGTPSATGPQCLLLIADTISFQGNPTLVDSGCTSAGLTNLPTVKTAVLAE